MMTHISSTFLFLLALSASVAAQNAGKTFSKSFNTDGKQILALDLPGEVDLKVWDNPSIRIEISVSLPDGTNPAMLNELANVGRYNLTAKPEGDALLIVAPNLSRPVKVKGQDLKEALVFVVYVPKKMEVELRNAALLAAAKSK
ncbi:MAG: hypothetical protein IT259_05635 [Saprospiraceae bacterium]|nr:hypothetical protein [Saprospiraceae bacterium]